MVGRLAAAFCRAHLVENAPRVVEPVGHRHADRRSLNIECCLTYPVVAADCGKLDAFQTITGFELVGASQGRLHYAAGRPENRCGT